MLKKLFAKKAGDLQATLNGKPLAIDTKDFSTGSVGWYHQGKVKVTLPDGSIAECQAQISLQVVDSKTKGPDEHVTEPVEADSDPPSAPAKSHSDNGKIAIPA